MFLKGVDFFFKFSHSKKYFESKICNHIHITASQLFVLSFAAFICSVLRLSIWLDPSTSTSLTPVRFSSPLSLCAYSCENISIRVSGLHCWCYLSVSWSHSSLRFTARCGLGSRCGHVESGSEVCFIARASSPRTSSPMLFKEMQNIMEGGNGPVAREPGFPMCSNGPKLWGRMGLLSIHDSGCRGLQSGEHFRFPLVNPFLFNHCFWRCACLCFYFCFIR